MKVLLAFFSNVIFNFAIGLLVAKFLGPAEYGRFALAFATAGIVQAAFFDWLRLGATRFYSERVRSEDPTLRATLDVCFGWIAFGLLSGGALLLVSGAHFALSNWLIGLALGTAIANGFFDFHTALVRARFHDKLYTRLIIVKNVLAFFLTGGSAFWFHSARIALIGGIISMIGSVVAARAALRAAIARAISSTSAGGLAAMRSCTAEKPNRPSPPASSKSSHLCNSANACGVLRSSHSASKNASPIRGAATGSAAPYQRSRIVQLSFRPCTVQSIGCR